MLAIDTLEQYLQQRFKKWDNRLNFDDESLDGLVISQGEWGDLETLLSMGANIQGGLVIRGG